MAPREAFRGSAWSAYDGRGLFSLSLSLSAFSLARISLLPPSLTLRISFPPNPAEPGVWTSPFDLPRFENGRLRSFGGSAAELLGTHFTSSVQVSKEIV